MIKVVYVPITIQCDAFDDLERKAKELQEEQDKANADLDALLEAGYRTLYVEGVPIYGGVTYAYHLWQSSQIQEGGDAEQSVG